MKLRHLITAKREARRAVGSWNALRADGVNAHDDDYWEDVDLVLMRHQDIETRYDFSAWRMVLYAMIGGFIGAMAGVMLVTAILALVL